MGRPLLGGFARVVGRSMLPTLRAGDLLWGSYPAKPRVGGIVVARFADGTVAVKRAARRESDGNWWLSSDNADEGIDSRHRGAVPESDLLAMARARICPRPRRL